MMCVLFFIVIFYVCVHDKYTRNNTSIFNFKILFDGKINLVDALGGQNSKFPVVFKSAGFWCNSNFKKMTM